MSLLGAIRGTPGQLWAMVGLLQAAGGEMAREALQAWLQPKLTGPTGGSLLGETIEVGSSLGLLETGQRVIKLTYSNPLRSIDELADRVHARLAACDSSDKDHVLFSTYAFILVKSEVERGTQWLDTINNEALAAQIDDALGGGLFNSTKFSPWRRWIDFAGLSVAVPQTRFYPFLAPRLMRELASLAPRWGAGVEIPIEELLGALAERMPYLDGGTAFLSLCARLKFNLAPRHVSHALSTGLRELQHAGLIEMVVLGDVSGAYTLSVDPFFPARNVKSIILKELLAP